MGARWMTGLRVEELARRADVSVDTIRFYQKRRLLATARPAGPHRLVRARARRAPEPASASSSAAGFSLAVIRRLLDGELDPSDAPLAAAVAGAAADAPDGELLTLDELAAALRRPRALLEAVVREGILVPHAPRRRGALHRGRRRHRPRRPAPARGGPPAPRAARAGPPARRRDARDRGGGRRPLRHARARAAARRGRSPTTNGPSGSSTRSARCCPRSRRSSRTTSGACCSRSRRSTSSAVGEATELAVASVEPGWSTEDAADALHVHDPGRAAATS